MKTKLLFAALVCCASLGFAAEANAKSWRVNHDQRAAANFLDLNAAMSSGEVTDGDTLYMDKGAKLSSEQKVTKRVTIIGPGYFIGENDADEAYLTSSLFLEADGIKITGLHTSTIYVRANNIVVERCRVTGDIDATGNYEADNASIRSCFIDGRIWGQGTDGTDGWNLLNNIVYYRSNDRVVTSFSNILMDHNIVFHNYDYSLHTIEYITNSTITNNIIYKTGNWSHLNIYNTKDSDHNFISHNIFNTTPQNGLPVNNLVKEYGLSDIFATGDSEVRDTYYELKDLADVKTYATDGGAVGPFSGAYPYVMCGYPLYVPRFESVTVPSQPTNGKLQINLVIKNQSE